LYSDILTTGTQVVSVYQGSYFISFLTNELCTKRLVTRHAQPTVLFEGRMIFPWVVAGHESTPRLRPLGESLMGNHIGVSTIAHSADTRLVVWRQAATAMQSEELLVSTGSGSCDWDDLDPSRFLLDTVASAMEREFHEESNPLGTLIVGDQAQRTDVIGYFRWIRRGGKPEFVGVSKLTVDARTIEANAVEVDQPTWIPTTYPAGNYEEMLNSVETLLLRDDLSVPLWVNLVCLKQALDEDRPRWGHFFWGDN
jgi:hypothetical protein